MSKKLLNETTIRRFGQLANMDTSLVSNFLQEMVGDEIPSYEREEEESEDLPGEEPVMDFPEEEPVMDFPEDDALGAEPADLASKVIQAVADALDIKVDIVGAGLGDDLDAGLAGEEELDLDTDLGGEEDLGLDPEEGELDMDLGDDLEENDTGKKSFDALVSAVLQEIESSNNSAAEELTEEDDAEELTEEDDADIDQEAVVQEVLRRVKSRIANLRKKKA